MINKKSIFKAIFLAFFIFLTACNTIPHANSLAAESNLQLGLAYLETGQMQLAKKKLLLALSENPKNSLTLDALGYFFERSGSPETAEHYYLRAISLATPNFKGISYNNYGTYLYRQKRFPAAISYFLRAAKDPNYLEVANAYENAGSTFLALGDKRHAKICFTKALCNNPTSNTLKQQLTQF